MELLPVAEYGAVVILALGLVIMAYYGSKIINGFIDANQALTRAVERANDIDSKQNAAIGEIDATLSRQGARMADDTKTIIANTHASKNHSLEAKEAVLGVQSTLDKQNRAYEDTRKKLDEIASHSKEAKVNTDNMLPLLKSLKEEFIAGNERTFTLLDAIIADLSKNKATIAPSNDTVE